MREFVRRVLECASGVNDVAAEEDEDDLLAS